MKISFSACSSLALFPLALTFACPVYAGPATSNLLSNPGAEAGSIAGWTPGGNFTPSVDSGSFDPGINPLTGNFDFYGVSSASDSLTQNISLVGNQGITQAAIDSGLLSANVSFAEQGLNQGPSSDDAQIQLSFLDTSGTAINVFTTPEIDSHLGTWQAYSGSTLIPVGTRSISYSMLFIRHVGSDLDAFVDDNSLTLSSPSAPVPEASTMISFGLLLVLGLGGAAFAARKKRPA